MFRPESERRWQPSGFDRVELSALHVNVEIVGGRGSGD